MKQKLLLLLLIVIGQFTLYAQQNEHFESELLRNGYTAFAKIKKEKPLLSDDNSKTDLLKQTIKFDNSITFTKISTKNIGNGLLQEKYQLYRNQIKIRGGEYLLHSKDNTIEFIHGFFASFDNENWSNANSEDNKKKYSEIAVNEFNRLHGIKDSSEKASGVIQKVELVYYFDYNKQKYTLAYQVEITSKNTRYSENMFISATNGNFLGAENLICTINFQGTAQTQYNGQRNIVADATSVAGPFRLQEVRNKVLIRTRNINNRPDLLNVTDFNDNDNNWTAAEHGNNRAAFDAHWGAETVYDYWLNVHNRNSINGNGMSVENYVHWDVPGDPNDFNARWFQNSMWYGDGFGTANPLTALDICAHEFGHGIDQFTGNLAYERESGALDEGFADIWGACIEAWATPNKQRWFIGEDVLTLRNMANPNAFGQPDTYLGNFWFNTVGCTPIFGGPNDNDGCGVHTNSGVLNFWFFLISDGGTGTNDLGNNYNVTGLGINTAAQIAYLTKQLMNNSLADYPLARAISIQAAQQLFGVNSCEEIAVTNAWFAVGVGGAYSGNAGMSITGDNIFCTTSNNYAIDNLPAGATVQWQAIPSGVVIVNSPNSPQTTLTTNSSNGIITLEATISNVCGLAPITLTKPNITVGPPGAIGILQYNNLELCEGEMSFKVLLSNPPGYYPYSGTLNVSSYTGAPVTWSLAPGSSSTNWSWSVSNNTLYVGTKRNDVSIRLRATARNGCGSVYKDYTFNSGICLDVVEIAAPAEESLELTLSPNPVTSSFVASLEETSTDATVAITEIVIKNKFGGEVKRLKFDSKSKAQNVDIQNLPTDVYIVQAFDGKKWRIKKIIKQ